MSSTKRNRRRRVELVDRVPDTPQCPALIPPVEMPRPRAHVNKRLKLKEDSFSESDSEMSRSSTKSRGKLTRSNWKIGSLDIETANRIAEEVTGYQFIDLRLPNRTEEDAANSMKWISTFDKMDVVIQRKLCMICLRNPMDAFLKTHVSKDHPLESSEVTEVMKRLSDVRYTRFCANGYVSRQEINQKYSSPHKIVNFLANCGVLIVSGHKKFTQKSVNYEKKFEEADVRGVSKINAQEILSKFAVPSLLFRDELEFSCELVTNTRMLDSSTQTTSFCHLCGKIFSLKNFVRHMKTHKDWKHEKCTIGDLTEVFKRITDLRTAQYYAAQPVSVMEVDEICTPEERNYLIGFLLDAGFVIQKTKEAVKARNRKIVVIDSECAEWMPNLQREVNENEDEMEQEDVNLTYLNPTEESTSEESPVSSEMSFSERSSRSSSVTSERSSASSTASSSCSRTDLRGCSSPSDEPFPYCILNAIPEHIEVEHALYDILEAMTEDTDFVPDQAQFQFLLGYSTYCLVVGNGSKQNVISRLTLGDFRKAQIDQTSRLHFFSFSTKPTSSQREHLEYLCADERIWRALEIFEVARERRAKQAFWQGMNEESSPFFCSFVSSAPILNDTNYPMSQFLRMCGINWPCRSGAICSAAWSLVYKDSAKLSHQQYAITYFQVLREKEKSQVQFLDEEGKISSHPTYKKISVVTVRRLVCSNRQAPHEKTRKNKRYKSAGKEEVSNERRGGDHKSEDYLKKTGRPIPERLRRKEKSENSEIQCEAEIQEEDEEVNGRRLPTVSDNFCPTTFPALLIPEYRIEVDGDRTMTCL